MRVLVLGASGMLGSDVAAALRARDHAVLTPTASELDIRLAPAEAYPAADAIINCAAYTAVDQAESEPAAAFSVNADAVARVVAASRAQAARLIHISTDYVFDGNGKQPYKPTDPTAPLGTYGRSKLAGEREVGDAGLVVRTAWLFGPNGSCFPRSILRAWLVDKPLRVVADQIGSPTYTGDLANCLADVLDQPKRTGITHIAGLESTTWHDLAVRTCQAWNRAHGEQRSIQVWPIHSEEWPTAARRPMYSALANCGDSRAMRPLDVALDEFVTRIRGSA